MSKTIPIQEKYLPSENISPELGIGNLIDDRFAVLPNPENSTLIELAKTATNHLYFTQDTQDQSDVVVKLHTSQNEEDHIRYKREQILVQKLQHPHLIPVVAVGVHKHTSGIELPYIATEYTAEGTLLDQAPRNEDEAALTLRGLIDAVDALGELHKQGLVHRDFKPANIFYDGKNAFLGDLGIAAPIQGQGEVEPLIHSEVTDAVTSYMITEPKKLHGSLAFVSPDRLKGLPATPEDDMFSVGVSTFIEFAPDPENRLPWKRKINTPMDMFKATLEGPVDPSLLPDYLPKDVIDTTYACMEPDAENRPTIEEYKALGKLVP